MAVQDEGSVRKGNAFAGFGTIGVVKQMGLMLGLAASVALGVSLVLWASGKDYKPLDANINPADMLQITQLLESNAIAYQVDASNSVVMVESSQLNHARMKLSAAGLLSNGVGGFDGMDKNSPLGSSQFMETARYRHALESELAKTIASITNVRSARVHLAIPAKSAFIREQQQPSASVFVERSSGRPLDSEQVVAIENLVASSIPELSAKNVTIVDQNGSLLSSKGNDPEISLASQQLDYTREVEKTLLQRVNNLLIPMVGSDNFKAEVSANIDFSQVEQTSEMFNPDAPAVRSEQTMVENRGGSGENGGIPGALSNQPPATGAAPEVIKGAGGNATADTSSANSASRKQDMRNYELDRSISYIKHQTGRIQRLTVAVVVDDVKKIDGENVTHTPWQAADLERLTSVVRDAVGYSAERGDSVNVVNSTFSTPPVIEMESIPIWQQAWVLALVKPIMSAIVLLALIFGLMRPVLRRLAENSGQSNNFSGDYGMAELALAGAGGAATTDHPSGGLMLPNPEAGYENQLTAVKGLVAQDSERVAQVIKQWVAEAQ